ncbi:MAG: hemerythrin domain-containing protein [Myxococcota bacterium]|nr:hemerythrin domain-containing protein [Myxococcota bacterium]
MAMRARNDRAPGAGAEHTDVVARLGEAHDRIREALAVATALAEDLIADDVRSEIGAASRADAARRALHCLMIDMALHEADEDASIGPRLADAARSLDGVIERVEEHDRIDALVAELAEDWRDIACGRALDASRHRARVARLRSMLEVHLAGEERHVFPRVAALPERERLEIIREMDERRDPP